ncbi:MAG: pentapeptide repeat-containing protein [Cyanobacteria bacterium P01_D01_bin.105]
MLPRPPHSSFFSRQSIHQLEERIQAIPTWLVAIIAFGILSVFVIFIRQEDTALSFKEILTLILEDAEAIALALAVILYVKAAPDRKTQKHYEAWRVIDTAAAANVTTSYARNKALRDLHHDGVPLKWLEAPKANLVGIKLPRANLTQCNLAGTNLEGANLRETNLTGANLAGANLSHADLVGSDLSHADLRAAILRGTDLTGANLWETNLANAEMWWANVQQEQLNCARLSQTVLPDGSCHEATDVEEAEPLP